MVDAQQRKMLPDNIMFEVWGNQKCTVKFTIMFDEEYKFYDKFETTEQWHEISNKKKNKPETN